MSKKTGRIDIWCCPKCCSRKPSEVNKMAYVNKEVLERVAVKNKGYVINACEQLSPAVRAIETTVMAGLCAASSGKDISPVLQALDATNSKSSDPDNLEYLVGGFSTRVLPAPDMEMAYQLLTQNDVSLLIIDTYDIPAEREGRISPGHELLQRMTQEKMTIPVSVYTIDNAYISLQKTKMYPYIASVDFAPVYHGLKKVLFAWMTGIVLKETPDPQESLYLRMLSSAPSHEARLNIIEQMTKQR